MKNKNLKSMFNKLVNNKISLYVVALIAFVSLYRYIITSEFSAVLLFFLSGFIAYNFSKNMTVVLGSSFLITTLATMSKDLLKFQEGMTDSSNIDVSLNIPNDDATASDSGTDNDTDIDDVDDDTFKNRKSKKKSGYQNQLKLNPALYNMPNKEQMQKQLGKATEMEQAYDNLEKIMGKNNIKSISVETKDLIKQQNELIKQLKTMTPALNDAMNSLGNLDLSKLTNMFNDATKNLSTTKE